MKKVLLSLAVLALIASPSFGWYGISKVPLVPGVLPEHSRPAVDGTAIVTGSLTGAGALVPPIYFNGALYETSTNSLWTGAWASASFAWQHYSAQVGASANYAVFGGPIQSDAGRSTYNPGVTDINVLDRVNNVVIPVSQMPTDGASDWGYTDVNNSGVVIWHGWPDPNDPLGAPYTGAGRILMSDVSSGTATTPVVIAYTDQTSAGDRPRISSYSDRVSFRGLNSGTNLSVYDIGDAATYTVATSNPTPPYGTSELFYKPAISDDGNWIAVNVRFGLAGNASNIYLIDITNINSPVITDITPGLPTYTRNDPSIEIIDADTALVVWDENSTLGKYNVKGVFVTGLSTNTPVPGQEFYITQLGDADRKYADVDGLLVAWHNRATGQVEYTVVPEPASLGLLALGGLALLRRR